MARPGPPAYAWDWFARQRLLWREARLRLSADPAPVAARYAAVDTRSEVLALLRTDYPRDEQVRTAVDTVLAEYVFLGRTDRPFAQLGITAPPRGLRWWWTALTGEDLDAPGQHSPAPDRQLRLDGLDVPDRHAPDQLTLGEVNEGYGS